MRPTVAIIDLAAIRHNINQIRLAIPKDTKIIAVVKANAYGHGAIPVSSAVLSAGANELAVAIVNEAIQLRQAGFTEPILVLGLSLPEEAPKYIEYNLTATISTEEGVLALANAAKQAGRRAQVAIKIDTGMGRIGLTPNAAQQFIDTVVKLPEIEVRGFFTHLATADEADKNFAQQQLQLFQQTLRQTGADKMPVSIISAANSATVIDLPEGHFSAVRPGIIIYGLPPSASMLHTLPLKPAMELKSRIVYLKRVPAGTPVSYGSTYVTTKDVYLATVPIGYADGYSRHLSGKAPVLVAGKRRKIVGRVCMDQIIVELGQSCDAQIGDEVVLFGRQGKEEISVTELADLAGTINYELVCAISSRVPRIYINDNA